MQGYRPTNEDSYGWARLVQTIANFFGGSTSIGMNICKHLDCDNYDNGVYLIADWEIKGRVYHKGGEQNEYDLLEMLIDIDKTQPKEIQLGEEKIKEKFGKLQLDK